MSSVHFKRLGIVSDVVTRGFIKKHFQSFPQDLLFIVLQYVDVLALPVMFQHHNTTITESFGLKNCIDVKVLEANEACCVVGPINPMISDSIGIDIKVKMPVYCWDACILKIIISPYDNIVDTIKSHTANNDVREIRCRFNEQRKEIEYSDKSGHRLIRNYYKNQSYGTQQDDVELSVHLKKLNDVSAMYRYKSVGPWMVISVLSTRIYVAIEISEQKEGNPIYKLSIADVLGDLQLFSCKDI